MKWIKYSVPFLFCILLIRTGTAEEIPVIAVAANFVPVLEEIGNKFTALTDNHVRISTGASGTLYRQIEAGAPFELFLSADENYVQKLYEKGLTIDNGRIYAIGILVLYIPHTSGIDYMQNTDDIILQIVHDQSSKLAVANPDLAPYGMAARQVLGRFTNPDKLQGREIIGENVGQTAHYALTGTVDAAFLPYSLVISPQMRKAGHFERIPPAWYKPIRQRMVLTKNAGTVARAFYEYLSGNTAKQIIKKSGYSIPTIDQ